MERFEGFADDEAKFFRALSKHQKREWFQEHKDEFEAGWNGPMKLLVSELRDAIDGHYPHCDLGDAKVFRIFRDVRFSKDKSPYKAHIAASIPTKRTGKGPSGPSAFYLHVGLEGAFAAAGYYMMEPADLARFRAAVADEKRGKELLGILAKMRKRGIAIESHGELSGSRRGSIRSIHARTC
jgi:uncharacterized protein (TIGR02453 family)